MSSNQEIEVPIKRFSPEARELLKENEFKHFTMQEVPAFDVFEEIKGAGRLRVVVHPLREMAIRSGLFLPGSINKTLEEQLAMLQELDAKMRQGRAGFFLDFGTTADYRSLDQAGIRSETHDKSFFQSGATFTRTKDIDPRYNGFHYVVGRGINTAWYSSMDVQVSTDENRSPFLGVVPVAFAE